MGSVNNNNVTELTVVLYGSMERVRPSCLQSRIDKRRDEDYD